MDARNSVDNTCRPFIELINPLIIPETKPSTPFMAPLNAPPIALPIDTATKNNNPHCSRYL